MRRGESCQSEAQNTVGRRRDTVPAESEPFFYALPLLVYIHGTRRIVSAIQNDDDLDASANLTPCALLAPISPAGIGRIHGLDS